MKIVLTRNVKDTGRTNVIVEVADGYALNFLIPKGLAVAATAPALKIAESRQKAVADRKAIEASLASKRIAALTDGTIVIKKKANELGHLYDAVDAAEIAKAANLPEEAIKLEKPFKKIGTHDVPVAMGEVFGKFSISIEAE